MGRFIARSRTTIVGLALIAVLSIAGIAAANRMIPDGTINTRDIKDNQVNTRDLRNGAIRGVDVHDGTLGLADLSPELAAATATATLFDPRAHGAGGCCLSWARGPETLGGAIPASSDPLPNQGSGQSWREAVLDPGTYLLQTTGTARKAGTGSEGIATRIFLGGQPVGDGGGYVFFPVSEGGLPDSESSATVIEVGTGEPAQRQLAQRAVALGGDTSFNDNLLVWKVTPR
jgi:hypothetical protein